MDDITRLAGAIPTDPAEELLAAMSPADRLLWLRDEAMRIGALIPEMSPASLAGALARTATARSIVIPRAVLISIAELGLHHAVTEAREAAIAAARGNGTLSASDQRWRDKATAATYALPEPWVVEVSDRGDGLVLAVVEPGGTRRIGPCVYPIEELENSTIRLAGWDRWGRPVDLSMAPEVAEGLKLAQRALSAVGCRMDDPAAWCAFVRDVIMSYDLRVPDPEPAETEAEERDRIIQAVRAAGVVRIDAMGVLVWVRDFARVYGPVDRATRRRWARRGWLVRTEDGRYTPQVRQGDRVGRVFAFAAAASPHAPADAGLGALDQRDREAVNSLNRPLRVRAAETVT